MSTAAQMRMGALPKGELLGRYRTYEDAQKVVDHLAASEDFDIKTVTIVGNDLRSVEHIRSRLSYPRVAGAGAAQGAMFGFFIGLLIWLFAPGAPVINMLLSVLLGVLIWTLIGVVGYAIRKGQRDFASSSQLVATTFDVVCDFSVASKARQLVANSGAISLNAWNDPTGRSANLGGAPAPGQAAAPPPTTATQPTGQPAEPPPQQRAGHSDLPDGRPRYGVRLDEKETTHNDDGGSGAAAPAAAQRPDQQPTAVPHDEAPPAAEADATLEPDPDAGHRGDAEGEREHADSAGTGAESDQEQTEEAGQSDDEAPDNRR